MFYNLHPLQTICTPLRIYFIVTLLQRTLCAIVAIACDTAATVNNTFVGHSLYLHTFVQLPTSILYKVMVIVCPLLVIVTKLAAILHSVNAIVDKVTVILCILAVILFKVATILPKVAIFAFYPFSFTLLFSFIFAV